MNEARAGTEDFADLRVSRDGAVASVVIHRPEKLNALNAAVIDQLDRCFRALGADPAVRAIVLTGAGEKAFVAGADIKELSDVAQRDPAAMEAVSRSGQEVFARIEGLRKIVIAAIPGFALGGGLELAMACHLRVASSKARLGLPEITLGILPGYGGTQRLPRLVGRGRALEMMLGGEPLAADAALAAGLVDIVVAPEELLPRANELAARFASRAPLAAAAILEAVIAGNERSLDDGCRLESSLFARLAATRDTQEGLAAFLAKRPPVWRGE
jgi:enoyl-CoA hydratase